MRPVAGQRSGSLEVVAVGLRVQMYGRNRRGIEVRCACGVVRLLPEESLSRMASCGCERGSRISGSRSRHGHSRRGRRTTEYSTWKGIRARCLNPKSENFADYGGRGIGVCERWASFEAFLEDMGPKPSAAHSIERLDVNVGYTPENCVWADALTQANNTRRNVVLTCRGETKTVAEWARAQGVPYKTLSNRLRKGWSVERALYFGTPES